MNINIIIFLVLILLTAFFVATEFSIVKVRASRIEQLVLQNVKGAKSAKKVLLSLDEYLSACQLGITLTSLGLGWIGEPTIDNIIHPLFGHNFLPERISSVVSFSISFILVTYIHVVAGELAPKTIAIHKAEQITLLFSRPIIVFYKLLYPFILILNNSAKFITSLFGFKLEGEYQTAHTEDEIKLLLSQSYESGEINQRELDYVNNIFEFDDKLCREVMVPRTEIVSLNLEDDINITLETIINGSHTRYPVTVKGNKDEIIGIVNIREIMIHTLKGQKLESILDFVKPVIIVIETTPINDLLIKMRKERTHMAVLLDEYGGTSGIATVEDILEEIVGDIQDEFDKETAWIKEIKENHYLINGKVTIKEINKILDINIDGDEVDTVGGWLLTENFDINPQDYYDYSGYRFTVKEIDKHHIISLEIIKIENNQE